MRKKRRPHREPRTETQVVTRLRREDVAEARKWLKLRGDPTMTAADIDALSPLVLFRRLVTFVRIGGS